MWISGYNFFHWVSLFGAKNLSLIKKQPLKVLGRMHCMLMDLLHGFEVLSTTEETLFNSRNVSRLVQNNLIFVLLLFV